MASLLLSFYAEYQVKRLLIGTPDIAYLDPFSIHDCNADECY